MTKAGDFSFFFKTAAAFFLCLAFAAMLFSMPQVAANGAKSGLLCCASIVIPALFPFMVMSEFVVKSGLARALGRAFAPVTGSLFALPGCCGAPIVMSFVGGYPVGARAAREMYRRGELTVEQARRMALFCVNAGPAFAISAVGAGMLGSAAAGLILFFSQLAASVCLGVALRLFAEKGKGGKGKAGGGGDALPLSDAFVEATASASAAMFSICAFVVFFFALTALMQESRTVDFLLDKAAGMGVDRERLSAIVPVLLEVTAGCAALAREGFRGVPLLAFCLSWAGLSVHFQVLSAARELKIPAGVFALCRLCSALLSMAFARVAVLLVPLEKAAFSSGDEMVPSFFSYSPAASIALLVLCAALLLSEKGS